MLERNKPKIWNVWKDGNMERALEVDFQMFGLSVVEGLGLGLDQISTMSFYARVKSLKERAKNGK